MTDVFTVGIDPDSEHHTNGHVRAGRNAHNREDGGEGMINESEREFEKVVHMLNEAGRTEFVISIFGHTDYTMNFEVREVASWTIEGDPKPEATTIYLSGFIKFDGDGHINFGERGYLLLCGEGGFKHHCQVISALYTLAESTIKNFNKEAAQ